jgi:cytochrome c
MKPLHKLTASVALAVATIAGAGTVSAEMSETGKLATEKAGRIMFEHRCRSCHNDDPAASSYGPSLVGVVGRKAGSLEGFVYSDALKNSGIVWTDSALKAWMADNTNIMPGTRMRHVGIKDEDEQEFILAYLKSLKK